MENDMVEQALLEEILRGYGFDAAVAEQRVYIGKIVEHWVKYVLGITLSDGRRLVVKIFHEDEDAEEERVKIEHQSEFSELLRRKGISTPRRYLNGETYAADLMFRGIPCIVTVEDWCGEEIREITPSLAREIGVLMGRMHRIALGSGFVIGCGTLFGAAVRNDVDAYPDFCKLGENERLDPAVVAEIQTLREEKMARILGLWDALPRGATQGDLSINNLTRTDDGRLTLFDYNNAGDEVLVSDLVLEGLLTAYEMDLPAGVPKVDRSALFPALLEGYLSVRPLSETESAAAWDIYTLYHGLWFTRILYHEDSLTQLVKAGEYDRANELLGQMLADLTEADDGRFRK